MEPAQGSVGDHLIFEDGNIEENLPYDDIKMNNDMKFTLFKNQLSLGLDSASKDTKNSSIMQTAIVDYSNRIRKNSSLCPQN